jgi:hypothetical protein
MEHHAIDFLEALEKVEQPPSPAPPSWRPNSTSKISYFFSHWNMAVSLKNKNPQDIQSFQNLEMKRLGSIKKNFPLGLERRYQFYSSLSLVASCCI